MDKSKTYIHMCKLATELNKIKWDYGFVDGDFIYLGDEVGVKVLGSDAINLEQSIHKKNGKKIITIELVHGDGITNQVNGNNIDINILEYPVDSYINPIWLPRQDQLESFYYQAFLDQINLRSWVDILHYMTNVLNIEKYKTMEQYALSIIMHEKFKKKWNNNNWIKFY